MSTEFRTRAEAIKLMHAYIPLAKKVGRRYYSKVAKFFGIPKDDVDQNALIGLWRAAQLYDPSRNVSFGTYSGVAMWHMMNRLIPHHRRWNRLIDGKVSEETFRILLTEVFGEQDDSLEATTEDMFSRFDVNKLIDTTLTPHQARIVRRRYFIGERVITDELRPVREVAKDYGVTRQAIDLKLKKAMSKLQDNVYRKDFE